MITDPLPPFMHVHTHAHIYAHISDAHTVNGIGEARGGELVRGLAQQIACLRVERVRCRRASVGSANASTHEGAYH